MAYIGGDQVLLFGGDDGAYDDETWVYDLSDDTWTQDANTTNPSARRDHALSETSMDGSSFLVLFGGNDGSLKDDTWTFGGGDYSLSVISFTATAGNALDFDGTNNYVSIPDNISLDITDAISIEAWIYPNSASQEEGAAIVCKGTGGGGEAYSIDIFGNPRFYVYIGGAGKNAVSSVTIQANQWYHLASVYNGVNVLIYVNGTAYVGDEASGSLLTNDHIVSIGSRQSGSTDYDLNFQGKIDEVRIWNDVRTETEIRDNMCKTLTGSEAGLVAYYQFNESSGTTADNSEGASALDGTLTNMTDGDWVTSGATIGNASTNDYSSPSSVSLASSNGDGVTISSITGSPDGVQIYRVDEAPNVTTPPSGLNQLSQVNYFGVFVAGGTSPTYTLTYNYDGHPGISNEGTLELAKRADNSTTSWTDANATLDEGANTLTLTEESGTEYILGSTSDNSLPVELTSFTARVDRSGAVVLEWVTESEIENLGFILERRSVGAEEQGGEDSGSSSGSWEEIASYITHPELQGQGSVTYRTEYSYIDNTVEIGKTYDYRLADVSYAGVKEYHSMTVLGVTVTEDIPDKFVLYPAYPNPFNPSTTIEFQLPEAVQVKLTVYDLQGREVKALINGLQEAGSYSVKFNGKNDNGVKLSSGIYFVLMRAKETTTSKKIVLLR